MATANSSVKSTAKGKYKLTIVYSFSTDAITWTPKVVISDALSEAKTFTLSGGGLPANKTKSLKKKQTYSFPTQTYKGQSLPTVTLSCNGTSVNIAGGTIQYTSINPLAPSSINAIKNNDAQFTIEIEGSSYATVPSNSLYVERCKDVYDENDFSSIPSSPFSLNGAYDLDLVDNSSDIEAGHRYWYRARTYNSLSERYSPYKYCGPYSTTPTDDSVSASVDATRVSNNQVNVSWSISSVSYVNNGLVTGFDVLRRKNGGSWDTIDTVSATSQSTQYSYNDTSCQADNYYQYAIQIKGSGGTSETKITSDDVIYMTPSSPSSVSISKNSSDYVVIKISNSSNTATDVLIERSTDGGSTWTQVFDEDYPCSQVIDETVLIGDNILYRARNYRDDEELPSSSRYSGYATSNSLQTKSKPNAPFLLSPVNEGTVSIDDGSVRLAWQHKPTDGSAQESANLQYKIGTGNWTTVSVTTQSYYTLNISSGFSAGDVISWRVRTKGAHADYSDYSNSYSFTILSKPEIVFTSPSNGSVITSLPISLAWTYSDLSGTLQKLTLEIIEDNFTKSTIEIPVGSGTGGSYQYSLSEFLFENDTIYGLRLTALSSSGYEAVANLSITIKYEPVSLSGGLLLGVYSDDDGYAYITVTRDITPDEQGNVPSPTSIREAYLYRVYEGERKLIASGLKEGHTIKDRYAPLNSFFTYELLMITTSGQLSLVSVEAIIDSIYWFVYWGEDNIARAEYSPNGQVDIKKSEKTRVHYSGRDYPVSYDSKAIDETFSFTGVIKDREERDAFKRMMRDGGRGIWKSADGDVYDADFEFGYSSDYQGTPRKWKCTLNVTRIDGD